MRTAICMIVIGALAGCLRPALVDCGELACATTQICHEDRCLDPSQLERCAPPIEEGTACDALGLPGRCMGGVCEPATCGDGYVDADLREVCDDSVPPTHCLDLGFDLGRPTCTACQPDASSGCVRFGWERVVDAASTQMWTDGTTLAYVTTAPASLEVRSPNGDVTVPGAFLGVHGANGRVVAWNSTTIVEVANGLMRMLPSLPTSIVHVRMDEAGTLYSLADCSVRSIAVGATSWTMMDALAGPSCGRIEVGPVVNGYARVLVTRGDPIPTELWEYVPTRNEFQRLFDMPAAITTARLQPTPAGDVMWVTTSTSNQVLRIDQTGSFMITAGLTVVTIGFVGDDVYFGDTAGNISRLRDGRIARFRSPTGGLAITGGAALYAYRGPIHRFTGITRGTRAPIVPATPVEIVDSLVEPDGTILALSRSQIHTPNADGNSWSHTSVPGIFAHAFAGAAPNYFISSFDDITAPQLIMSTGGIAGPWSEVTVPGAPKLHALWRDASGALFAVGDGASEAFLGVRRGTAWEVHAIAGCTVSAVDGIDATSVVAAGACGTEAVVWVYDGAQWTELARPALPGPLEAVVRFPDGAIVAAGTSGATWFDGTEWRVDRTAVGQALSGTSLDDVWLSGEFTTIQRFDGAVWSKLATSSSGPISVAASTDRVMFPGATVDFVELVR
ncbi:MAG: hypothetical protein ACKV2T_28655 [Kofleriaceae bacterium]